MFEKICPSNIPSGIVPGCPLICRILSWQQIYLSGNVDVMTKENTVRHFYAPRDYRIYLLYSAFSGTTCGRGIRTHAVPWCQMIRQCGPFGVYRCPWSSLLSYWIYRLVGSNFVWSCSQWWATLSLHRVTRVRRDDEGWCKSVRWHGKGKEKENLRVANLWEAT